MFIYAPGQVIGYANIERAGTVAHNVNVVLPIRCHRASAPTNYIRQKACPILTPTSTCCHAERSEASPGPTRYPRATIRFSVSHRVGTVSCHHPYSVCPSWQDHGPGDASLRSVDCQRSFVMLV